MSDWAEVKDPGSGKTYYYSASTGQTAWEKVRPRSRLLSLSLSLFLARALARTRTRAHVCAPRRAHAREIRAARADLGSREADDVA